MRVYELTRKLGVTYALVQQAAEGLEVEIYSPLSELDAADAENLRAEFRRMGADRVKAQVAAAAERAREKAARAAKIRAAHDRAQFEALEVTRRRAIEAAFGAEAAAAVPVPRPPVEKTPIVEVKQAPAPTPDPALVDLKSLFDSGANGSAGDPSVKIDVSGESVADGGKAAVATTDEDDYDDVDENDYLHGRDRKPSARGGAKKSSSKKASVDAESKDEADAEPRKPMAEAVRKAAPLPSPARSQEKGPAVRPPVVPAPVPGSRMRVGGTRAGFASVSMKTATMIRATAQPAAVTAAPAKPAITLSVTSREISIRGAVVVKDLAQKLGIRPNRLIADLMGLKVLASINQRVEPDVATKVAAKYGFKVQIEHARDAANKKPILKAIDADDEIPQDKPEDMRPRPPVVTFLGHVDHGKTTLMDHIRHTKVAAGEAGGITQQISAYQVDVQGRKITFLDTPGHAAFNAMRQRGAQLTDIAVIIIAADDGIMPQTEEAIKFARQAGVQIMVAITKCDKPTANEDRVKQQLQAKGLTPEEWGGDVVTCPVSGLTGKGVDQLLEMILLQADVLELTANPRRRANGYVIEAELEQGFGPSATLLVTGGTLKVGDAILIGEHFGKVRSLIDDHGRRIKEAPPATPVKCTGLSGVPDAGAEFRVMLDEKRARSLAEESARLRKEEELSQTKAVSFDDLLAQMGADGKRELSVIVKSDTQGSLEAIVAALREIKSDKVALKIIATGTGNVSLTDVKGAAAGKAIIVGFDVGTDSGVQGQARHDGVRINSFRIIYELMDFVKKSMLDLLPPEYREVVRGHAEIKAIYDIGRLGKIAGSQMRDGTLLANARFRILRGKEKVWEGKLQSLKHFKDEVKEVTGQQECGVCFQNYEAFAVGDLIECYVLEELPRSL